MQLGCMSGMSGAEGRAGEEGGQEKCWVRESQHQAEGVISRLVDTREPEKDSSFFNF